jgi:hypothetical protein
MGKRRGAYRALVEKPEEKRKLGRPRRRWEDNITMNLNKIGCDGVEWIYLALDGENWLALLVNAEMNLSLP